MVSYDEALDSLVSMFGGEGSQWTRQALDQVLRHHEGMGISLQWIFLSWKMDLTGLNILCMK